VGSPHCIVPFQHGTDNSKRQEILPHIAFTLRHFRYTSMRLATARACSAHACQALLELRAACLSHPIHCPMSMAINGSLSSCILPAMEPPSHCLPSPPCRSQSAILPQGSFLSRWSFTFIGGAMPCCCRPIATPPCWTASGSATLPCQCVVVWGLLL
jgi:hypothetical protein